jgi:hypothetical protein
MAGARVDANPVSLREAVLSAMTPSEIRWIVGDRGWDGFPRTSGSTSKASAQTLSQDETT